MRRPATLLTAVILAVVLGSTSGNHTIITANDQLPAPEGRQGSTLKATVAVTPITVIQWPVGEGGNDHWYAVLESELFWFEADSAAATLEHEGEPGYLATISSPAENQFVMSAVIGADTQPCILDLYWLGGLDIAGQWLWQSGEPMLWTNWLNGEPNNKGVETALCLWGPYGAASGGSPGKWNNALPDDELNDLHKWWSVIEWGEPDSVVVSPSDTLINLVQWPAAAGGNDHWYAVLTGERYWFEARVMASTMMHDGMAGYLATVTSPAENEFILNGVIAGTYQPSVLDMFWLGGLDVGMHWTWLSNEPFVYMNWSTGEPNNIGIETALGMWGYNQSDSRRIPGKWNNSLPDHTVNPLARFWTLVEWGEPDTTLPPPVCGNGILEPGEECDDGNLVAGDGCDPMCVVEDEPPQPGELINLVQWPAAAGGNDHWYAVLTGERYWFEAREAVDTLWHQGMPGYLATSTSPVENDFILTEVLAGTHQTSVLDMFWLGGRDINGWLWVNGEPFIYSNWSTGEPNNVGIETALGMWGPNQTDPRRIPGKWNNALPDPTVNPYSRFWTLVEWGEPDTTIPPPVCGNGIVEPGEECDDGNLVAGDGCDPWCGWESSADVVFMVDTDTGNGTLFVGEEGSIVISVIAPQTPTIAAFSLPFVYHFSRGNIIGPIAETGDGARVTFSDKARSAFEVLAWNQDHGLGASDPDTTLAGLIDFGGTAWSGSGELLRITFVPQDTGTIFIDSVTMPHGALLEVIDQAANNLSFVWQPTTITVVQGMPTGDLNGNVLVNSNDIVSLVNYLFKGGPPPAICEACGDVDCSGTVTASDLIALVNYVFKGGVRPCNAGDLVVAGVWMCP